jgi:hypothetical protein
MMVQCWQETSPAFIYAFSGEHWRCQSGTAKKRQQINKEGCSTTKDIQAIGATYIEN